MNNVNIVNAKLRDLISLLNNEQSQGVVNADLLGSHLEDSLMNHFDILQHNDFFTLYNSTEQSLVPDTLLIVGVVNKNVLTALKDRVERLSSLGKRVVYISGGLDVKVLADSYFRKYRLSQRN